MHYKIILGNILYYNCLGFFGYTISYPSEFSKGITDPYGSPSFSGKMTRMKFCFKSPEVK